MLLKIAMCSLLAFGALGAGAEMAEARLFGRSGGYRATPSRSYASRPAYRPSRGYAVRGPSPLTIRVSPARYRYLKTFYPTLVRDR